jgi:hypothetical protein
MGKTNDMKVIIKNLLDQTSGNTYYESRPVDDNTSDIYQNSFKVFEFESINSDDISRDDYILTINVWGRNVKDVEQISDDIEDLLRHESYQSETCLPTFYTFERRPIPDEDKTIKRRQIKVLVNNYYIGE